MIALSWEGLSISKHLILHIRLKYNLRNSLKVLENDIHFPTIIY